MMIHSHKLYPTLFKKKKKKIKILWLISSLKYDIEITQLNKALLFKLLLDRTGGKKFRKKLCIFSNIKPHTWPTPKRHLDYMDITSSKLLRQLVSTETKSPGITQRIKPN